MPEEMRVILNSNIDPRAELPVWVVSMPDQRQASESSGPQETGNIERLKNQELETFHLKLRAPHFYPD